MFEIEIINRQGKLHVDQDRLIGTSRRVLSGEGVHRARVNVAIVDDATIHEFNWRYLHHDDSTDVISFTLERMDRWIEGDLMMSAETAIRSSDRFGWKPEDELMLYLVHGLLHLVGYDDTSELAQEAMRLRERYYLAPLKLYPRYEETTNERKSSTTREG